MSSILESIRSVKNPFTEEPAEAEVEDDDTAGIFRNVKRSVPKLSYKQRVIGFCICIGVAALFAILGCVLAALSPATFAVLFTVGTIAGVFSTFFLVSPIAQAKAMCDPSDVPKMIIKICCAVILFAMIVLAFCATFWWKVGPVAILFCVVEFIALVIYAITLIPYATTIISRGAKTAFSSL